MFALGKIGGKGESTYEPVVNKTYNETQVLSLGLSMYKYALGIDTLFYVSPGNSEGLITNYDKVAQFFTNEFIANAESMHICWPIKKADNLYYRNTDCGFGGPTIYKYKGITIKEYSNNKIVYEVTLDTIDTNDTHTDSTYDFEIVNSDNIWKIDKFTYLPVQFD